MVRRSAMSDELIVRFRSSSFCSTRASSALLILRGGGLIGGESIIVGGGGCTRSMEVGFGVVGVLWST